MSYLTGEHGKEDGYYLSSDWRQKSHPSVLQVGHSQSTGHVSKGLTPYRSLTSASVRIRAGWLFPPLSLLLMLTMLELTLAK